MARTGGRAMAGTGGRLGRIAAIAVALAIGLLLLAARGAGAGVYTVVQCGWGVGADATWSDSTGGGGFAPESSCAGSPADALGGGHLGTFIGPNNVIRGGGRAAWRWVAPVGTGFLAISGYWWQGLAPGIERQLGIAPTETGFATFAVATDTTSVPAMFSASFPNRAVAFEDRLVCTAPFGSSCVLDRPSSSAIGALAFRIEDTAAPRAELGGELFAGGWRRGVQSAAVSGADVGSGVRSAEVRIDGAAVATDEFACAKVFLGTWMATLMQPCLGQVTETLPVATEKVGDGAHGVAVCVADFAEDVACTPERPLLTDNAPPDSPRGLTVTRASRPHGGGAYDVAWTNPDQGPASPIAAALWQVTGPGGYDSGVEVTAGAGISALAGLRVPRPDAYTLRVWLRDEAGNGSRATAVSVPLSDGAHGRGPGGGHHRGAPGGRGGRGDGGGAKGGARVRLLVHLRTGDDATRVAATTGYRGATAAPRASGRGGSLTVPFGTGATVSGRLTDRGGAGIVGRRLLVVARPWRGATAATRRRTVTTGRHGGFALPLAPGPSRRVAVRFAGGDGLAPARRDGLDLRVRSGVTLSAAPAALETGEEVQLSGRVRRRGAAIPHSGKLVAIQYLEAATHRWRPALVVRSDRRGRFDTSYRFRYVSGTARIRLRATALAEGGWPYAPGSSPAVTVEVRGG